MGGWLLPITVCISRSFLVFYSFCRTLLCVAAPARNLLQLPSRCIHLLQSGSSMGCKDCLLHCDAEKEFLLHCVFHGLHRLLAPAAPSTLLMWLTFVSTGLFGFFFLIFLTPLPLACCAALSLFFRYVTTQVPPISLMGSAFG